MNSSEPVIYIVEDESSFRKSLERLIHTWGIETVSFESAGKFLSYPSVRHPSCLLLDICLPDFDGLLLQQKLLDQGNALPIIFMTGHGDIPMSVEAMKKGAVDFLPKPLEPNNLKSALDEALAQAIVNTRQRSQQEKIHSLIDALTPRELEIMRWVIAGKLNKEIAYALEITEKTVKVHRARVMQKTGVDSVAELVRLAAKANIIPAE